VKWHPTRSAASTTLWPLRTSSMIGADLVVDLPISEFGHGSSSHLALMFPDRRISRANFPAEIENA
jgi:hypothetical protein